MGPVRLCTPVTVDRFQPGLVDRHQRLFRRTDRGGGRWWRLNENSEDGPKDGRRRNTKQRQEERMSRWRQESQVWVYGRGGSPCLGTHSISPLPLDLIHSRGPWTTRTTRDLLRTTLDVPRDLPLPDPEENEDDPLKVSHRLLKLSANN